MSQRINGELPCDPGSVERSDAIAGQSDQAPQPEVSPHSRWLSLAVCLFLVLAVWAVFGQTLRHEFVNYDDDIYVYKNPVITQGLSINGVVWAFTQEHARHWHPLTSLSHMLDCQLYGLNPGGHHLTNVLLHASAAILLFLVLRNLTGAFWPAAFVAAVFAVHPLRVESVAWVSERKDVLSACFGFLALLFYARYAAAKPEINAKTQRRKGAIRGDKPQITQIAQTGLTTGFNTEAADVRPVAKNAVFDYGLALFFFACALLSKSMLVTLPFILLLLDYWPLRRFHSSFLAAQPVPGPKLEVGSSTLDVRKNARTNVRGYNGTEPAGSTLDVGSSKFVSSHLCLIRVQSVAKSFLALLLEKWPFLLLSAVVCMATILAQQKAIKSVQGLTFPWRAGNAAVAYATYLGQMVYPARLALFYPHPGNHLPGWKVGVSVLVLLIISIGVIRGRRKHPYLLVGWLWYLGMLVPVIGLMQVGAQARADRYTYLPQIGLCILLTWGAVDLCRSWRYRRAVLGTAAAAILVSLLASAYVQTGYWENSISLWTHTLACTSDNPLAHYNLGTALSAQGKWDEAIQQYEQSLQLNPDSAEAHNNLGGALAAGGKWDEAITHYERALQLNPDSASAHYNSGIALAAEGKWDEAIAHYERALQLKPQSAATHYNLGLALAAQGKWDEAIAHYERALQLNPRSALAHYNLGLALAAQGKLNGAIPHLQQALNLAAAHNNTALAATIQTRLKDYESALPR